MTAFPCCPIWNPFHRIPSHRRHCLQSPSLPTRSRSRPGRVRPELDGCDALGLHSRGATRFPLAPICAATAVTHPELEPEVIEALVAPPRGGTRACHQGPGTPTGRGARRRGTGQTCSAISTSSSTTAAPRRPRSRSRPLSSNSRGIPNWQLRLERAATSLQRLGLTAKAGTHEENDFANSFFDLTDVLGTALMDTGEGEEMHDATHVVEKIQSVDELFSAFREGVESRSRAMTTTRTTTWASPTRR